MPGREVADATISTGREGRHVNSFGRVGIRTGGRSACSDSDDDLCLEAMDAVGVLAGGERQRVRLTLALAQGTGLILLDEPLRRPVS